MSNQNNDEKILEKVMVDNDFSFIWDMNSSKDKNYIKWAFLGSAIGVVAISIYDDPGGKLRLVINYGTNPSKERLPFHIMSYSSHDEINEMKNEASKLFKIWSKNKAK